MNRGQRQDVFKNDPRFKRMSVARKNEVRRRLRDFDALPERQKQLRLERYQLFRNLPSGKQRQARQVYQDWRRLPAPRRQSLMKDLQSLRGMNEVERRTYAAENGLQGKYSQHEMQVLRQLVGLNSSRPESDLDTAKGR
jgi:hypothetical protein